MTGSKAKSLNFQIRSSKKVSNFFWDFCLDAAVFRTVISNLVKFSGIFTWILSSCLVFFTKGMQNIQNLHDYHPDNWRMDFFESLQRVKIPSQKRLNGYARRLNVPEISGWEGPLPKKYYWHSTLTFGVKYPMKVQYLISRFHCYWYRDYAQLNGHFSQFAALIVSILELAPSQTRNYPLNFQWFLFIISIQYSFNVVCFDQISAQSYWLALHFVSV